MLISSVKMVTDPPRNNVLTAACASLSLVKSAPKSIMEYMLFTLVLEPNTEELENTGEKVCHLLSNLPGSSHSVIWPDILLSFLF